MQKLLREPRWGLWFHILERVNSETIPHFLNVIAQQIKKVQNDCELSVGEKSKGLTLHVCVLKPSFSLQKDVPLSSSDISNDAKLLKQYLNVSSPELTKVENLNGWELQTKSQV